MRETREQCTTCAGYGIISPATTTAPEIEAREDGTGFAATGETTPACESCAAVARADGTEPPDDYELVMRSADGRHGWDNDGYGEPSTGTLAEVTTDARALWALADYADATFGARDTAGRVTTLERR